MKETGLASVAGECIYRMHSTGIGEVLLRGRQNKRKDLVTTFRKNACGVKSNIRTTKGEITCLSLNALRTLEEGDISGEFREGIMTEVEN